MSGMDASAGRMSAAAYIAHQGKAKGPTKYRNQRTEVDGIWFDSKAEADRWRGLKLLERAGQIRDLDRQVNYPLAVNGVLICDYRCDFTYDEAAGNGQWRRVVEDVKGVPTPAYLLKKALMFAVHGIEIREVRKP